MTLWSRIRDRLAGPPPRPKLYVCHPDDMHVVHPATDWEHCCERCKAVVGIYPSGQEVIRKNPNVEIVCGRCEMPKEIVLAPGVLREMGKGIPRVPRPAAPAQPKRRHRPF